MKQCFSLLLILYAAASALAGCSCETERKTCRPGQTRCSGDVIQQCYRNSWLDWIDCASANAACVEIDGDGYCVPLEADAGVDTDHEMEPEAVCELDAELDVEREADHGPDAELAQELETESENEANTEGEHVSDTEIDTYVPGEDIEWVSIPGGSFQMGSDDLEAYDNEQPVHQVTVPGFEMARTEVTVAQYRKCVDAGVCTEPATDSRCNWNVAGRDSHPVNCLDWNQARAFSQWVGGRLPTEAEWEFAARSGGRDRRYPWGDQRATCAYAVMDEGSGMGCGQNITASVCSKTAGNTDQGLCDMAGNVFEWVEDDYHADYTGAPVDGCAWVDDPRASNRVFRGGSFFVKWLFLRASYRSPYLPTVHTIHLGFRPARTIESDADADTVTDADTDTDTCVNPSTAPNGDPCCENEQGYPECEPSDGRGGPYIMIPAATFWMGCRDDLNGSLDCFEDELPQHEVHLSSYGIDKYEITQARYKAFVDDTGHREPYDDWDPVGKPNHPLTHASWYDVRDYCQWVGGRLPTEAQWEYAARGPMSSSDDYAAFPWGTNEIDCDHANYYEGCSGHTDPVGSRPLGVSPFGVHDLSGNAKEWCLDWYDSEYYAFSPVQDPEGPCSGGFHSMRGGSWWLSNPVPGYSRSSIRIVTLTVAGARCSRQGAGADADSDADVDADTDTDTYDSTIMWVTIEGGTYMMGNPEADDFHQNEQPVHEVVVSGFQMARTEVTIRQYQACVDAGGCTAIEWSGCSSYDSYCYNFPVSCVSWEQARAFSAWVGGRLPSESEWEYAARSGGKDKTYPWGEEESSCEFAIIRSTPPFPDSAGCNLQRVWEVCSRPKGDTEHGLCDMAGNVSEWVEDDYHENYENAPSDCSAWFDDPRGPQRVIRGGSYTSSPDSGGRTMARSWHPSDYITDGTGFRPVKDLDD